MGFEVAYVAGGSVNVVGGTQAATSGIKGAIQQTVSTSAVQITVVANSTSLSIKNNDANNTLYLGSTSGVTTGNGFPVEPKGAFAFDVVPGSTITIWAIASGSTDVRVIGVG